jgi:hypothetical protein
VSADGRNEFAGNVQGSFIAHIQKRNWRTGIDILRQLSVPSICPGLFDCAVVYRSLIFIVQLPVV